MSSSYSIYIAVSTVVLFSLFFFLLTKNYSKASNHYVGKSAGFWIRFLAQMVDVALTAFLTVLFWVFIIFGTVDRSLPNHPIDHFLVSKSLYGIAFFGTVLIFNFLLSVPMTIFIGRTFGKNILNIRVNATTGKPLNFRSVVTRYFSYSLFLITFGYGIVYFSTKEKKGIHDRIAGTKVIYIKKPNFVVIVVILFVLYCLGMLRVGMLAM